MGHIITKFLGWHVYNEVIDNGIDGGDLLIDDLCSRIAANQTAAAIRIIKSVPSVYDYLFYISMKSRYN